MSQKYLYAANLPHAVTDLELRDLFSQYGTVHEVRIAPAADERAVASAFIKMEEEEAARALEELQGREIFGHRLEISWARGEPGTGDVTGTTPVGL